MKTQEIEFKESGGTYDGNLILTRDSSGNLVITTPAGTVKIKDGLITLSGNLIVGGFYIGTASYPQILFFDGEALTLSGDFWAKGEALFGKSGAAGIIRILNNAGAYSAIIDGSNGDATFKGGLNVGSASGAAPGGISLTQYIRSPNAIRVYSQGDPNDYFQFDTSSDTIYLEAPVSPLHLRTWGTENLWLNSWTGGDVRIHESNTSRTFRTYSADNIMNASLHVGTATGGAAGDIKASGDIIAADALEGKTLQLQIQITGPPSPSAAYAGMLWHIQDEGDTDRGKLYVCLRTAGSSNYSWVLIAQGL